MFDSSRRSPALTVTDSGAVSLVMGMLLDRKLKPHGHLISGARSSLQLTTNTSYYTMDAEGSPGRQTPSRLRHNPSSLLGRTSPSNGSISSAAEGDGASTSGPSSSAPSTKSSVKLRKRDRFLNFLPHIIPFGSRNRSPSNGALSKKISPSSQSRT